jgi:hypothetical protein
MPKKYRVTLQSQAVTLNEFIVTVSEKTKPVKTQVSFSRAAFVYLPSKAKKTVALQAGMLKGVVAVNAVEVWAETKLPIGQIALIIAKHANVSIRVRLGGLIGNWSTLYYDIMLGLKSCGSAYASSFMHKN